MPLPDRTEPVDVRCPACASTLSTRAVVTADGEALWFVCMACGGYSWDAATPQQAWLFEVLA